MRIAALILGALLLGYAAKDARYPTVDVRYYETSEGKAHERSSEQQSLNAALIRGSALQYKKATELLKAAETPEGGNPQQLMRAGRTLSNGDGVVLLATVRGESSGGSATKLAVFQVALNCDAAAFDGPGDLKNCNGYAMRVPKTWPAEVYDLQNVTVSIIPEGGTARGRMHGKSVDGNFGVELDGEFSASLVEYAGGQVATTNPSP
ncbi:MAG: hypothetical protein ACJ790_11055 [Myxococcaceae bacterium]